ncbi:MAG: rod shape-determining protein [Clostridia bacterium]|nr:rod shape-determining protein [Clostridia bacterium]MDD4047286.1 rod shape-determining protein [Clostridia bacterium]
MVKSKKVFSYNLHVSKDIGIDLGTANTIVFIKSKGIIINEPSVVAINSNTNEVLAVGNEANNMIGRTPAYITAIRPLKDGVISDYNITKLMLSYFIKKALKGLGILKPRVLVGVPLGITQVERKAVIEAAQQAGAKEAYIIEEPIAAAIGAGLPVEEPRGNMVIDIGGGTTEVAILSLGGIVEGKSLRIGGDEMNQIIARGLKKKYSLDIGIRTAENLKISIGYAIDAPSNLKQIVRGINLTSRLPDALEIKATEISEFLSEPLNIITEAIHSTLEKAPPELASDLLETGMTLTGGGALLKNIDKAISKATNMPVQIADDPLSCVAMGIGKALDEIKFLRKINKR